MLDFVCSKSLFAKECRYMIKRQINQLLVEGGGAIFCVEKRSFLIDRVLHMWRA